VIRAYSPSRTVGGGTVIEPVAVKRRRADAGLGQLEVHETGSLEARLLEKLGAATKMLSTDLLAEDVGEPVLSVGEALARLAVRGTVVEPVKAKWVSDDRWAATRELVLETVRAYAEEHPSRCGVLKGSLKSGLKSSIDAALFDAAFGALEREGLLALRAERVRPGGLEWEPPAEVMASLRRLEQMLEAEGYLVPDNLACSKALGATYAEVVALGHFLGRLVRVDAELTYTQAQMDRLKSQMAEWFATHAALTVADLRGFTGASRKYAVPLLEHSDRVGWTVRVGDERKWGG